MNLRVYLKFGVILLLTMLLLIPLGLIQSVIWERNGLRQDVVSDIAQTWTGEQFLMGPVLSIPYEYQYSERHYNKESEEYENLTKTAERTVYLIAASLTITGDVETQKRSRGIYSVPVYTSKLALHGDFLSHQLDEIETGVSGFVKWKEPRLSVVLKDVRGIASSPVLHWNSETIPFLPGSVLPNLPDGVHSKLPLDSIKNPMSFSIDLNLRGSRSLQVSPLGNEVMTEIRSNWPHPKFTGKFLPSSHEITSEGFTAAWSMTAYSTGIEKRLEACVSGQCSDLTAMGFGVQFIETVDVYQKVTRAAKYGLLFIVLTFIAFALLETLTATQLHPIQYSLVGVTLAIFYLMLLSLSEHITFGYSYLFATLMCVVLISVYLSGVFRSLKKGSAFGAGVGLLYAMLYKILQSEDFALLMGSLLLFAMLATVMFLTKRLDWYQYGKTKSGLTNNPSN